MRKNRGQAVVDYLKFHRLLFILTILIQVRVITQRGQIFPQAVYAIACCIHVFTGDGTHEYSDIGLYEILDNTSMINMKVICCSSSSYYIYLRAPTGIGSILSPRPCSPLW